MGVGRVLKRGRVRVALLLTVLLAAALALYYDRADRVRVETVEFESVLVGRKLPYKVLLPRRYGLPTERGTRYPVLYLLHGWGGGHGSWLAHTSLEQYAAAHRLIVVMPEGGDGWYTDAPDAPADKFETYFFEELIADVERRYRAAGARGGRAVAGYSMGGYGALKFGLKRPDLFAFAGSTSGALDAAARTDDASIMRAFGPPGGATRAAEDLPRLAREFPAGRKHSPPYFYLDCGTRDPWLAPNRALADLLLERGFTHEFRQLPGGHDWPYWDRQLRDILRLAEEYTLPPHP